MPKAHRLPSGSWNCRVFVGYEMRNGEKKRKYQSITADTKRECERQAAMFSGGQTSRFEDMTVLEAVRIYIDSKQNILSPSTLRGYESIYRNAFADIGSVRLSKLTVRNVQEWTNDIAAVSSPKTVRNKLDLFLAAYKLQTGILLNVSVPSPKKPDLHTPTTEEIETLLAHVSKNERSKELELCIRLAAFCGLRLSEICALEADDFKEGFMTISKARIPDPEGFYVTKQPKTLSSYRQVPVPESVSAMIPKGDGRIIKAESDVISKRFKRAVRFAFHGTVSFRFHDLRHYYASVTHALGVPDEYIMRSGGWKTDHVMKRVYRDALPDVQQEQGKRILAFFDNIGNAS